jgi:hypothetical protein
LGFGSRPTGRHLTVSQNAHDMNGICTLPQRKISRERPAEMDVDRSAGPRAGWIYIVTTERGLAPAGNDPDVIFHRSTDGGASWSAGAAREPGRPQQRPDGSIFPPSP